MSHTRPYRYTWGHTMRERGRVFSLVVRQIDDETKEGEAIQMYDVLISLPPGKTLTPDDITVAGQDNELVKHSARRGGWIAYNTLKSKGVVHAKSVIAQSGVTFDFEGNAPNRIDGASAGLCFLAKMAQEIIEEWFQLTGQPVPAYDFAATGILHTIKSGDKVDRIDAIKEKIEAALNALRPGGAIYYPQENDPLGDALRQQAQQHHIELVAVETPAQALAYLLKKYGIHTSRGGLSRKKWWALLGARCLEAIGLAIVLWMICQEPLQVQIFYEDQDGSAVLLPQGKALTTNDGVRIRLQSARDYFIYILWVDSHNSMRWIFPQSLQVYRTPHGEHWVPDNTHWFAMDATPGTEEVFVFATSRPADGLENMRKTIDASRTLSEQQRSQLRQKLLAYLAQAEKERRATVVHKTFPHR